MQTRSLSGEVIGAAVVVDGAAGIGDGAGHQLQVPGGQQHCDASRNHMYMQMQQQHMVRARA